MVDTDALLSSSPSLIWLQLGFGLAGAVTIMKKSRQEKANKGIINTFQNTTLLMQMMRTGIE